MLGSLMLPITHRQPHDDSEVTAVRICCLERILSGWGSVLSVVALDFRILGTTRQESNGAAWYHPEGRAPL